MHQSIPAAPPPPPPPPGDCGVFARLVSPGGGNQQSTWLRGRAFANPTSPRLLTRTWFSSLSNISKHAGFYWTCKQTGKLAHLSGFNGMFPQFYACNQNPGIFAKKNCKLNLSLRRGRHFIQGQSLTEEFELSNTHTAYVLPISKTLRLILAINVLFDID